MSGHLPKIEALDIEADLVPEAKPSEPRSTQRRAEAGERQPKMTAAARLRAERKRAAEEAARQAETEKSGEPGTAKVGSPDRRRMPPIAATRPRSERPSATASAGQAPRATTAPSPTRVTQRDEEARERSRADETAGQPPARSAITPRGRARADRADRGDGATTPPVSQRPAEEPGGAAGRPPGKDDRAAAGGTPPPRIEDLRLPPETAAHARETEAPGRRTPDAVRPKSRPEALAEAPPGAPPVLPPTPPGQQPDAGLPAEPAPPDEQDMHSALHALRAETDLSNCLIPLLEALGWRGHPRHVAESIPHFIDSIDITSLRNVMANLHYESWPVEIRIDRIDPRLMPCLFLPNEGDAMVVLGLEPETVRVYDGGAQQYTEIPRKRLRGTAYFFNAVEEDTMQPVQAKVGWFRAVGERFRGLVYQTLGLTLLLNVLALATPLFVMAVYDKVVPTGSMETLGYFAVGVGIAILCDLIIRGIRARIMSFIGARLDNIVGNAVFQRILFLPPTFTERATVGAQVARIKDFENVREFFTGPMALTFFELPFTTIFIIVIAVLGGPVAIVPIVMVILFILLGAVIQPLIRNSVARAARGASRRQELLIETLGRMRTVKHAGADDTWMERFREYSAKATLNSFYTSQYASLMQTISTVLMTASGLATIAFGVFRVLGGHMTIGALVASMILVWRVLAPLQTAFISMTRLAQVRSSIGQINALMNLKPEREPNKLVTPLKRFEGRVSFSRVSIRYSPEADPALVGVSFDVQPGEVVVIVGGNGSGKSTVLKLLMGMYLPQAGSIRIDDQDIRQLDVIELRHAIAYVPQVFEFFYGTIAQNLRLTNPTASDEELRWAVAEAGCLEDVLALEQGSGKWRRTGFDVRIGDSVAGQIPTSLLQRLNLARGYLRRAPVMLFDEPGNGLDFTGDQAFMRKVDRLRGTTTVFIVTHRPSHLKMADKILWLDSGHVRAFGPADEVQGQMPKEFL